MDIYYCCEQSLALSKIICLILSVDISCDTQTFYEKNWTFF